MCELLAMSARYPARLTSSLTRLAARAGDGSRNRDGWGIAFYQDKDVVLCRDITPASVSPQVQWLEVNGPATTLSLAYIRHATQGLVGLSNTGPYARELDGRMLVFTHNGNLTGLADAGLGALSCYHPVGETDSELAFCLLLERLRQLRHEQGEPPDVERRLQVFADFCAAIRELGPASCMLADGDILFVHADRRMQSTTGMIEAPALHRHDCPVDRPGNLLRDSQLPDECANQRVTLIATVPLDEYPWQAMKRGEILALRHGQIIASFSL